MSTPKNVRLHSALIFLALAAATFAPPARAATFTVLNTNVTGAGSLQQALFDANTNAGPDVIAFAITNLSRTITPTNALPALTETVTLDAASQPGFAGAPLVELNGTSAGTLTDGLRVLADNCVIRALVINRYNGDGIEATNCRNLLVEGCYVGLGLDGVTLRGNAQNGINLTNAPSNTIGGINASNRNLICGNSVNGILIGGALATNNLILGNVIGLDLNNADKGNNQDGIRIFSSANIIGGTNAAARNVISGNGGDGIEFNGVDATLNQTYGNFIGTDASGILNRGNSANGLLISTSARSNYLGAALPGAGNIIAYNSGDGISIVAANAHTNNPCRGNAIYLNGDLGIDLAANGVSVNDAGDADVGANQMQNFPVLTAAANTPTEVLIGGTLNGRASTTFVLDFYANAQRDPTGSGEGQYYLGATNVTTDGAGNTSFTVSLPSANFKGRFVSATATDPFGNTSEFATNVTAVSTVAAATITVINTNDTGVGSLRQAILDANANIAAGPDTIAFNIPGSGVQTNRPASALPVITDAVIIDGYTQPGTATNTSATAFNGTVLIRLDGTQAGSAVDGLAFGTGANTVRGLIIAKFSDDAIDLSGGGGNVIEGNLLGINPDSTYGGNTNDAVHINGSGTNTIGGLGAGARNVISWNNGQGLDLSGVGAAGNQILGNLIGTDLGGTLDCGNLSDGVLITSISNGVIRANVIAGNNSDGIELNGTAVTNVIIQNNFIGTDASGTATNANSGSGINLATGARLNTIGGPGFANVIAFNTLDGVAIVANNSATNNSIRANRIFLNGDLGIDLGATGVTTNDVGDVDVGANQQQNFPVLAAVTNTAVELIISGSLQSRPGTTYTLDFYANVYAEPSGAGEGQTHLGSTNLTTDAASNLTFLVSLPITNLPGRYVTATATDPFGNTSEFASNAVVRSTVPGLVLTVVNTNDNGPGSLRQAILDANAAITAGDTIAFAITNPSTTIRLATALPTIIDPVTIDGYTQPGAAPNTSPAAFNGNLLVTLDGTTTPTGTDGLRLGVGLNVVRGLVIINFPGALGDAIDISAGGTNSIEGNLLGIDVDGTDRGNGGDGVRIVSSPGNLIGGTSPAVRNVISGNTGRGVDISGTTATGNQILGNLIGTDATGTLDVGNNSEGVLITSCASNFVGGLAGGARNVISGNNNDAVEIVGAGAVGNVVLGNYIGTAPGGDAGVGNSGNGVFINGTGGNTVGGTAAGAGNLISANYNDGIELSGATATNNLILGNWIGVDAGGTAALGNSGAGVLLTNSANRNIIGGVGAGEPNLVANNLGDGVFVNSGTNNIIRGNAIYENGGLGLDLGNDGVTANDAGDADTGANQLQNFPVLTGVTNTPTEIIIAGFLNSRSNTVFTVDFYANPVPDPLGIGEGRTLIGSTNLTTDATSNVVFLISLPVTNLPGRFVSATATDPSGNTSEFATNAAAFSTATGKNFVVINTNDSGPGSLRQAIDNANAAITTGDTITFNITNVGPKIIALASPLPVIADTLSIDAFTQPGASPNTLTNGHNAALLVRLDGASAGAGADGFRVSGTGCLIRGLAITRFNGDGVKFTAGVTNRLEGCYLGLDLDGATVLGNGSNGVEIVTNATGTVIGGGTPAARCVISGNNRGVYVAGAASNFVQGCRIGTDAAGALARGNTNSGVFVSGATARFNTLGDTTSGGRNVISGNGAGATTEGHGVTLSACVSNFVIGNFIGTTATGAAALGNQDNGIDLAAASTNAIGGTAAGAGNVISGNDHGIRVGSSATARANWIQGNLIGTDASGTKSLPNTNHGISFGFANYNLVGGAVPAARNVISGNGNSGVNLNASAAGTNTVQGNFIGTDLTGVNALGNGLSGVDCSSSYNRIGGTNSGEGNRIAFNVGAGVTVLGTASACPILGNAIYTNGLLGIDLYAPASPLTGVSTNDPGDADTGGNSRQNFPELTLVTTDTNSSLVFGTLNSRASTPFRLEFFDNATTDPSGNGEGQTFIGFTNVTTDAGGNVAFTFRVTPGLAFARYVTVTATDPTNNTSEFSAPSRVLPFNSVDLGLTMTGSADPIQLNSNLTYTITVTNTGPTNATSVVVTDALPAGLKFISATASQGSCGHSAGVVTCSLGTLNKSATATISLVVQATNSGAFLNSATASAAQFDHAPANNTATRTTTCGRADVRIALNDSPDPVIAGEVLTLTMFVTNNGPDPATLTTATFGFPFGFIPVTNSTTKGTLTTDATSLTAHLGTLAVGGWAQVTMAGVPSEVSHQYGSGHVACFEADPDLSNNDDFTDTLILWGHGIFQFSSPQFTVSESGVTARISVRRVAGSGSLVSVNYATYNLSATPNADFTPVSGTLSFDYGIESNSFLVPIAADLQPECTETVGLRLFKTGGDGIAIGQTNAVLSIFDDETSASGTLQAASAAAKNLTSTSDAGSIAPSLSADGRYVAFQSASSNVLAGDFNSVPDVFLYDRVTRNTTLVSHSLGSTNVANASSTGPYVSADGRFVAFTSVAGNLITNNPPQGWNVYLYSVAGGTNRLVSVNTNGVPSGNSSAVFSLLGSPISTNGQVITFQSAAYDLVAGDTNAVQDVFVRDLVSGVTKLVTENATHTGSASLGGDSSSLSADGRFVIFKSLAADLAGVDLNDQNDIFVRNLTNNTTVLVSVNLAGTAAGNQGASDRFTISANGRYVAFESTSTDLVPNDPNGFADVFRRDLLTGVTELVSINRFGTNSGNIFSTLRGMSADGRYVLFSSFANDLVTQDVGNFEDVFVRDMQSGTTRMVSLIPSGLASGNDDSFESSISQDGRFVAFASYATNLTSTGKSANLIDIFVRDLLTGVTTLVSTRQGGGFGAQDDSLNPQVSADGQVVVYRSVANNIADNDENFASDVFAWQAGTNTLLGARVGATGNNYSQEPTLSSDGTKLAFVSYASNLAPYDTNFAADVFVRDLTAGQTELVSVNAGGVGGGNWHSIYPRLSLDGRYVSFVSFASDLVNGDVNAAADVFRRDRLTGLTTLVSVNHTGTGPGNADSSDAKITPNGQFIVFESAASDLVTNDLNGSGSDIFLRDLNSNTPELVSVNFAGTGGGNGPSTDAAFSSDARYVAFETDATDLFAGDTNNAPDILVRDRLGGSNILISINLAGTGGGNGPSYDAYISTDGRYVVFESDASDLVAGDTNQSTDVFVRDLLAHTTRAVSTSTWGVGTGNDAAYFCSLSPDGRYIAFESRATNLVANDINGPLYDVFLRDTLVNSTALVSANCNGTGSGNGNSYSGQVSSDGRYITFASWAWDLANGDYSAGVRNLFRRDLLTGQTVLVSQNLTLAGGGAGDSTLTPLNQFNDASQYQRVMSPDGRTVAFVSSAPNLVADDLNGQNDIFVWRSLALTPGVDLVLTKRASLSQVAATGNFSYTITVTNAGTSNATSVVVTDALPAGVTFVSANASQGSVNQSAGVVTANLGGVNSTAGASLTINVTAGTGGSVTNSATVAASQADANPGNNSNSVVVTITSLPSPSLTVAPTNSQILITWPGANSSGFTLETTTNLTPVIIWVPVTNTVNDGSGLKSVLLPVNPAHPTRFYRLRK